MDLALRAYCMSLSSFDSAFSSACIWPPTVKLAGFCREFDAKNTFEGHTFDLAFTAKF